MTVGGIKMIFECPFCEAELVHEDSYGRVAAHQDGKIFGQIYKCPNAQGFQTKEAALNYESSGDLENWEDITCESSVHHVSGSFYTDLNDNLQEGYPC